MLGRGVDRHLFALYVVCKGLGRVGFFRWCDNFELRCLTPEGIEENILESFSPRKYSMRKHTK